MLSWSLQQHGNPTMKKTSPKTKRVSVPAPADAADHDGAKIAYCVPGLYSYDRVTSMVTIDCDKCRWYQTTVSIAGYTHNKTCWGVPDFSKIQKITCCRCQQKEQSKQRGLERHRCPRCGELPRLNERGDPLHKLGDYRNGEFTKYCSVRCRTEAEPNGEKTTVNCYECQVRITVNRNHGYGALPIKRVCGKCLNDLYPSPLGGGRQPMWPSPPPPPAYTSWADKPGSGAGGLSFNQCENIRERCEMADEERYK